MFKPLTVHPTNSRYFTDGSGKSIYLTGSHTWNNLQHNEVYPSVDYDKYHGSIADGTESIALIGESDWDVESIEVKIRDAEGEWFALVWRYQDLSNFDSWWLSIAGGALEAWPKVGDYEGAARASGAVPFDPAKEFTFKVVINGNDFEAFFNGEKIETYTNDAFATGQVGFLVWGGSATFDDVVITGPNISGDTAVRAAGKIASVWGKLKTQ